MSDYFRVMRGVEIDEKIRILQGENAPGVTADTDNAPVGSTYSDTIGGEVYVKHSAGVGTATWRKLDTSIGANPQLYSEYLSSPTLPSAQGPNSIAIGQGATTDITASSAIAIGEQSLARHPGAQVFSAGRFQSTGDAQTGKYLLRTHTINATLTEAFLDGTGGSARLVLPDDSTWTYKATIVGHRTDGMDGHAGYTVDGVVYRMSGANTTALLGKPIKQILAESNTPWDINITADATNGSLSFFVKGQSGKTIRWLVLVETVEITN